MDRTEIKAGMKVVCKDGLVYCEFETTLEDDDGRWCFMPGWLEPWKGE